MRLRSRSLIRSRRSSFVLIFILSPCMVRFAAHGPSFAGSQSPAVGLSTLGQLPLNCELGARLSDLLLQALAGVPHALLLVGVRFAQPADVRRHLADQLAV